MEPLPSHLHSIQIEVPPQPSNPLLDLEDVLYKGKWDDKSVLRDKSKLVSPRFIPPSPPEFDSGKLVVPSWDQLWINEWIMKNLQGGLKVLEAGAGKSTWYLYKALRPELYVCVEEFKVACEAVRSTLPMVQIYTKSWDDIPREKYDFIFVDSSVCCPRRIKPLWKKRQAFRHDFIHYILSHELVADRAYIVLHDWLRNFPWAYSRKYLEAKKFDFVRGYGKKPGVGIYQKP